MAEVKPAVPAVRQAAADLAAAQPGHSLDLMGKERFLPAPLQISTEILTAAGVS